MLLCRQAELKHSTAVGIFFEFFVGYTGGWSGETGLVGSEEQVQRITFTLGDSDIGDAFDVQVLVDPKYNTPVFKPSGVNPAARTNRIRCRGNPCIHASAMGS
jgi:hypothetical protein